MRTRFVFVLAAAVSSVLASVSAQQQMQMPKPAPQMSEIAFFEGQWSCSGKMHESPMGPAGTATSTADIRRDLGGFWQVGTIKASAAGMNMEGRYYAIYDPAAKQYVMVWMDSMGGWARSTASGWKGDTMVYEGESHMGAESMKTRDSFTRNGAGAMKHTSEAQIGGKWMTVMEETCTKK